MVGVSMFVDFDHMECGKVLGSFAKIEIFFKKKDVNVKFSATLNNIFLIFFLERQR
jgi:hypothetical protein